MAATDAFQWGYDPVHYGVPEGSYATDPDGPARILEYRCCFAADQYNSAMGVPSRRDSCWLFQQQGRYLRACSNMIRLPQYSCSGYYRKLTTVQRSSMLCCIA